MDGWITLGAKLDTKDLEKELNQETKKLSKYEKEHDVLINAQVKFEKSKAMKEYAQIKKQIEDSYSRQIDMTYSGGTKGNQELEAEVRQKIIEKEQAEIKKLNEAYAEQFQELKRINTQLEQNNMQQELTKKNIDDINEKLTKSRGYDGIKKSINEIGKGTEKVSKKVGRWALAIIGVRSAYFFIRQSISTLSEYNEKLAKDIQGIRLALASAVAPVIEWIINLVKKLIGYLGYLIYKWTGKNIFADMNKNLKKANGQAKELQKTLAGFDEMNVLQDNKSTGGGDTSGVLNLQMPTEVPGWIEWMGKNGKLLLAIFGGIAGAILGMKLGLKGIKALGLGIMIAGIVKLIQDIISYIKDPSWDNFANILIDIGIILVGLALLIGSWPLALAGAIVLMVGLIAKFWDNIKEFFINLKDGIYDLGDKITTWLHDKLGFLGDIIGVFVNTIVGVVTSMIEGIIDLFDGLFTGLKGILDGIISIFKEGIGKGLVKIFKGAVNVIIGLINFLIDGLNLILSPIRALVVTIGKIMGKDWTMDNIKIPKLTKLARGGIVHNPGKGVMMGNYIAGEGTSPEAVLPLNDETLDRLGEKIAKHMTINADIKNYMNGRVISRELHKINNESEFAYNR